MIKTPFEVSFLYTKGGNTMEIDTSRYREGLPQIGYAPYLIVKFTLIQLETEILQHRMKLTITCAEMYILASSLTL